MHQLRNSIYVIPCFLKRFNVLCLFGLVEGETAVQFCVCADSSSLHLVMKGVLMHAKLLLSDPLMFGHVEECAALYILVIYFHTELVRALPQMYPNPTAPIHHYEPISYSS